MSHDGLCPVSGAAGALARARWARCGHAIEARTGPVRASRQATAGLNSTLGLILDADVGSVFVKDLPADHPMQRKDIRVALPSREACRRGPGTYGSDG
jgi:hypothetical protein